MSQFHIRCAAEGDASEIARIHVEGVSAIYSSVLDFQPKLSITLENRERTWHTLIRASNPKRSLHVACNLDGQVVGFSSTRNTNSQNRNYEARLLSLYVDDRYRGQGIGTRLFKSELEWLRLQKINSMTVWVMEGSDACRFYEKLGGELLDRAHKLQLAGQNVQEAQYAWKDIASCLFTLHDLQHSKNTTNQSPKPWN